MKRMTEFQSDFRFQKTRLDKLSQYILSKLYFKKIMDGGKFIMAQIVKIFKIESFANLLKEIAVYISAIILWIYLWFCYHTSDLVYTGQIDASLRDTCDAGISMIYLFWHDEFMLVALSTFSERLRPRSIVTGTQFGGLVSARFSRAQGIHTIFIDKSESREQRISRIENGLRLHPKMGIAADYGAPWFTARPTSMQIAHETESLIVPVHVESRRSIIYKPGGASAIVPLPFSTYTFHASTPICPTPEQAKSDAGVDDDGARILNRVLNDLRKKNLSDIGKPVCNDA